MLIATHQSFPIDILHDQVRQPVAGLAPVARQLRHIMIDRARMREADKRGDANSKRRYRKPIPPWYAIRAG